MHRVTGADPIQSLAAGVAAVAGAPVELERPADARHGDYATTVALHLAGERRQPPREVAAELAERIDEVDGVAGVDVAGPGFLNLTVDDAWLGSGLATVLAAGRSFGSGTGDPPERIQVELVSANPTGPITVASARNGVYGDAVARLLEFAGHDVEREYYYNDAGAQMDRFRESVEAIRRGRSRPRTATAGSTWWSSREGGRPGAADARADRGDPRALSRPLRHLRAAERRGGGDPDRARGDRHLRVGRRDLGEDERPRRRP